MSNNWPLVSYREIESTCTCRELNKELTPVNSLQYCYCHVCCPCKGSCTAVRTLYDKDIVLQGRCTCFETYDEQLKGESNANVGIGDEPRYCCRRGDAVCYCPVECGCVRLFDVDVDAKNIKVMTLPKLRNFLSGGPHATGDDCPCKGHCPGRIPLSATSCECQRPYCCKMRIDKPSHLDPVFTTDWCSCRGVCNGHRHASSSPSAHDFVCNCSPEELCCHHACPCYGYCQGVNVDKCDCLNGDYECQCVKNGQCTCVQPWDVGQSCIVNVKGTLRCRHEVGLFFCPCNVSQGVDFYVKNNKYPTIYADATPPQVTECCVRLDYDGCRGVKKTVTWPNGDSTTFCKDGLSCKQENFASIIKSTTFKVSSSNLMLYAPDKSIDGTNQTLKAGTMITNNLVVNGSMEVDENKLFRSGFIALTPSPQYDDMMEGIPVGSVNLYNRVGIKALPRNQISGEPIIAFDYKANDWIMSKPKGDGMIEGSIPLLNNPYHARNVLLYVDGDNQVSTVTNATVKNGMMVLNGRDYVEGGKVSLTSANVCVELASKTSTNLTCMFNPASITGLIRDQTVTGWTTPYALDSINYNYIISVDGKVITVTNPFKVSSQFHLTVSFE